jgi:transcriptional regulator with XRE-family HTH domain
MSTLQKPTVGQRLLQERKKHSWSQQMLADKIGTTVLAINRWEHDKTQPQPYYREKLCEVFGKSHDELFGEPEEEERAPIWNIPHLRNLYFTGREEILMRLHNALTITTKKAVAITQPHAISGLGGIGKTQAVIEYAYRYSDEYKAILWARADSRESLISEVVALATLLDLPEKNEADKNKVVAAVMRWLQNAKGWLLIFDNADDLEIVSEFLPARGAGHTLLTTRSQATGKNIKGIEIEKMGREESALLLLRRAKLIAEDDTLDAATQAQRKDAEAICELMDGLPLALDQAAAYIEENECSLQDYLSLYQTHRTALLNRRGTFSKRDYPKPVVTTWSLSFEQVQENNPAAADLLRLCAFLHPDAIPEEMISTGAAELGPILQLVAEDSIQWVSIL